MVQHNKYDSYGFRIKPKKTNNNNSTNNDSNKKYSIIGLVITFILLLVCFALMLMSGYIAWYCYANDLPSIRVLKSLLAAIFFYLYLPYFIFLRIILKTPCLV